ncbi:AraC-like DNA-binding protein [Paenibacillus phyllosphaerae]|uniref:AraC-like DNA-binding protein n=1 Tax=Paenibacillus phyllosphaerae TaxID=274593 RepID=A0A7W5B0T2_9BACL|nr:AraC family transcriptional regulator [Paenibacillus phyllosphaerae]MBB3112325.1 AraC-like DNA-binding protein [Paenibacillus phyllosphaerae]
MSQLDLRRLSLNYSGAEELRIEGGSKVQVQTSHEDAFVYAMKEGIAITAKIGGKRRSGKLLSGELVLLPYGTECTMESTAKHESHVVFIRFRRNWQDVGEGAEPVLGKGGIQKLYIFRMPQIRSWIQDFLSDGGSRDEPLYYQLQSHLYAIASALLTSVRNRKEPEEDVYEYVEQTRKYMVEQFHKPIDVEQLAAQSGSSASRFYQSFRRYTGLSPHKYLTKVRLDASLRLLAGAHDTVMDVAHSVGYVDEFYFSRLFKKHLGLSPTEYAQLAACRVATLSAVFEGDLAALGLTPVFGVKRKWAEELREGIGLAEKLEAIAAAQPDLILTGPVPAAIFEALSAIAPTVELHWKRISWKERLQNISDLLGLGTVAERWLSYYDQKVENARCHVRRRIGNDPLLLVIAQGEGYRVYGTQMQKMKDLFYDDLQVTPPPKVRELKFMDTDNLDDIAKLGCDNVMFFVDELESEAYCQQLEEQWRAKKRGRAKQHCLFVRYQEHINYNAAVHERLVEETVLKLLESG